MIIKEETSRSILNKSKSGEYYLGKTDNRYTKSTDCHIITNLNNYNSLDMDKLFKLDILELEILVQGKTNKYTVKIILKNIISELKKYINNNDIFTEKDILNAITSSFNNKDIFISCSCPDFTYSGFNYYSAKRNYNSNVINGPALNPPKIKNPLNTKGSACKHIIYILRNLNWLKQLSVILYNYILYIKEHKYQLYLNVIYPKLYDNKKV